MAVHAGPDIVTDGLILHLDAANARSYPGSGTTWTDLSDRGNNLTTSNSPPFSTSNGGYFGFNGSSQSASRAGTLAGMNYNNFSVVVGFRSTTRKQYMALVGDDVNASGFSGYTTELSNGSPLMWSNNNTLGTTEKYDDGKWHIAAFTMKTGSNNCTIFVDGVSRVTGTLPTPSTANTSFLVASWGSSGYNYAGDIAFAQIYNRTLESAEVVNIYNALRGRFGL